MKVMIPKRMVLYEIADRNGGIVAWYKACGKIDSRYYTIDYASHVKAEMIIEPGTSFDEVEKIDEQGKALFSTEEECRAYCEYLNEKNRVTSDIIYEKNGDVYEEKEVELE